MLLRKSIKTFTLSLVISMSYQDMSMASGWPTFDIITHQLTNQLMAMSEKNFSSMFNLQKNNMSAEIESTKALIDNTNNASANTVVRITQSLADIHNNELQREIDPAFDACNTYSVSKSLEDAVCDYVDGVSKSSEQSANKYLNKKTDKPTQSAEAASEQNVKDLLDKFEEFKKNQQEADIIRSDILHGSRGDTFDKSAKESTEAYINLVSGPKVDTPPAQDTIEDKSRYVNSYLRKQAIRQAATESLNSIRQLRMPSGEDGPSKMQLLQSFVDDRFGTEEGNEWLKKITNTDENTDSFTSETEVIRSLAEMTAFNNALAMERYQSQQRQEQLQALELLLKVEPLV